MRRPLRPGSRRRPRRRPAGGAARVAADCARPRRGGRPRRGPAAWETPAAGLRLPRLRTSAPSSPFANSSPLTPSWTVSANPPVALAITGTPRTRASIATSPSGSACRDGATSAQASTSSRSTLSPGSQPRNRTASTSPSSPTSRSRPARCGPVPTSRSRAVGALCRSRAKARSKSASPFLAQPPAIGEDGLCGGHAPVAGSGRRDWQVEDVGCDPLDRKLTLDESAAGEHTVDLPEAAAKQRVARPVTKPVREAGAAVSPADQPAGLLQREPSGRSFQLVGQTGL